MSLYLYRDLTRALKGTLFPDFLETFFKKGCPNEEKKELVTNCDRFQTLNALYLQKDSGSAKMI
jgi:hypothetical protein